MLTPDANVLSRQQIKSWHWSKMFGSRSTHWLFGNVISKNMDAYSIKMRQNYKLFPLYTTRYGKDNVIELWTLMFINYELQLYHSCYLSSLVNIFCDCPITHQWWCVIRKYCDLQELVCCHGSFVSRCMVRIMMKALNVMYNHGSNLRLVVAIRGWVTII